MTTDTSERGLERLICTALTGSACDPGAAAADAVRERPATYGAGWICGDPRDYEREYCVDLAQLSAFLRATQPEVRDALDLGQDGPTRRKFLARLQGEITKRGTIDVLRHGLKHGPHHLDLLYGTPSPGNAKAAERYAQNRFCTHLEGKGSWFLPFDQGRDDGADDPPNPNGREAWPAVEADARRPTRA